MQPSFVVGPNSKARRMRSRSCLDGAWRHLSGKLVLKVSFLPLSRSLSASSRLASEVPSSNVSALTIFSHLPASLRRLGLPLLLLPHQLIHFQFFWTLVFFALGVTIEPDIAHIQPHSQHLIITNQLFQPLSAIIGVPPGVRPRRSCFTTCAIVRPW